MMKKLLKIMQYSLKQALWHSVKIFNQAWTQGFNWFAKPQMKKCKVPEQAGKLVLQRLGSVIIWTQRQEKKENFNSQAYNVSFY